MKIIFDSEEQKRVFIAIVCPNDINLDIDGSYTDTRCEKCWEKRGIEMEVKDEC